jgi:carboxymethylenebutenolidase
MNSETLSFDTANGPTSAYVSRPAADSEKAVIIVQEWWGLNDHIKDIANRYAAEGFTAIAPDLYRGRVANDPNEASQMMNELQIDDGLDTIASAVQRASDDTGSRISGLRASAWAGRTRFGLHANWKVSAPRHLSTEMFRAKKF